jgi:hypothetical protein
VVDLARGMLAQAIGEGTRGTYKSAVNHLDSFCTKHGMKLSFPVDKDTLCLWMASSAQALKFASIRVYLHGIATTQVELGFDSPLVASPNIWRIFKGIKRLQGVGVTRKRLPITTNILNRIESLQDTKTLSGLCLRAAMWTGTCGLLRAGEFAHRSKLSVPLLRQHLSFHGGNEEELKNEHEWPRAAFMKLHIAQSKTDPFRVGTDVIIANDKAMGAMCDYLRMRGSCRSTEQLFTAERSACLTVQELVTYTQSLLTAANVVDAKLYKGHSFRKGGATSLHEAGFPDSLIKTMGRWLSFAFATYVQTSNQLLIRAGKAMTAARVLGRTITFEPNAIRTWD